MKGRTDRSEGKRFEKKVRAWAPEMQNRGRQLMGSEEEEPGRLVHKGNHKEVQSMLPI